jgi:serine/threonine-protein kinase RsbW
MYAEVRLILRGHLDHLLLVWQAAEQMVHDVPLGPDPASARHCLLVGLQEMLTNILRHGYRGNVDLPVEVVLRRDDDCFEVVLLDEGPAFDPTASCRSRRQAGASAAEGGYGIPFVLEVMDDVRYTRVDDRNVLTLTKRMPVLAHERPAED